MTHPFYGAMPNGSASSFSLVSFQLNRLTLAVAHLSLAAPLAVSSSASWAQAGVSLDTVTVRSSGDTRLDRSVGTGSRLDLSARDTPASVEVTMLISTQK